MAERLGGEPELLGSESLLLVLPGGLQQLLDTSRTSMDFPCSVCDSHEQVFPFLFEQEGVLLINP